MQLNIGEFIYVGPRILLLFICGIVQDLSNVTMVDKTFSPIYYVRYHYKNGTIVLSILSAIIRTSFDIATISFSNVGLFELPYSAAGLQGSAEHLKNEKHAQCKHNPC